MKTTIFALAVAICLLGGGAQPAQAATKPTPKPTPVIACPQAQKDFLAAEASENAEFKATGGVGGNHYKDADALYETAYQEFATCARTDLGDTYWLDLVGEGRAFGRVGFCERNHLILAEAARTLERVLNEPTASGTAHILASKALDEVNYNLEIF